MLARQGRTVCLWVLGLIGVAGAAIAGEKPMVEAPKTPLPRCQATAGHIKFIVPENDFLSNLNDLEEAYRQLKLVEAHLKAGRLCEAQECQMQISRLVPGSPLEARVETILAKCLKERNAHVEDGTEEAEPSDEIELPNGANPAPGVREQTECLIKACRLAIEDGRQARAIDLAREAAALWQERVQADPVVYRLYRLAEKVTRSVTLQPGLPQVFPDIVFALDELLMEFENSALKPAKPAVYSAE